MSNHEAGGESQRREGREGTRRRMINVRAFVNLCVLRAFATLLRFGSKKEPAHPVRCAGRCEVSVVAKCRSVSSHVGAAVVIRWRIVHESAAAAAIPALLV